jgi:nitric oxide reductase NorE protein
MTLKCAIQTEARVRVPAEGGIWILICGDLLVFSLFFITLLYYRGQNLEVFSASAAQLNQALGALNTLFMLSSSWFVALAIHAARGNRAKPTAVCFALAVLCGVGFAIVKVLEYGEKIRAGITFNTNDFFMYYYVFTGIHLLHVLLGMGVLVALGLYARSGGFTAGKIRNLESGAIFWHLVDLLWIVLFALLYLIN